MLLTRISARGAHPGSWTLPGGGIDHGESPRAAVVREVREECGIDCTVGELVAVQSDRFDGTAPTGRHEDFHGVNLVFDAIVADDSQPAVAETDGTTDAVAWVGVDDVASGRLPLLEIVGLALEADGQ